jgi:hypothetical protein
MVSLGLFLCSHLGNRLFGFAVLLVDIETNRDEQDRTLDHGLGEIGEAGNLHGIVQHADDQNASNQAEDDTLAANEADSAQQGRRQAVERQILPRGNLASKNPGAQATPADRPCRSP